MLQRGQDDNGVTTVSGNMVIVGNSGKNHKSHSITVVWMEPHGMGEESLAGGEGEKAIIGNSSKKFFYYKEQKNEEIIRGRRGFLVLFLI